MKTSSRVLISIAIPAGILIPLTMAPSCQKIVDKKSNLMDYYDKGVCLQHGGVFNYGGASGLPVDRMVFCYDGTVFWDNRAAVAAKEKI